MSAQQAGPVALDPNQATKLAELMCRQLPNAATVPEIIQVQGTNVGPAKDPFVDDDVYDALVRLGPYAVPCLVDRLTDVRWMPDPREEPLMGQPVVGDVAYMILRNKGVLDVLPELTHKKPDELWMGDYVFWPRVGDHRRRLQIAVRTWLLKHPNCCAAPTIIRTASPSLPKFQMSAAEVARARIRFSELRPGMNSAQVLKIAGKPDAIDRGNDGAGGTSGSASKPLLLLGYCANNHNETLAYIYFIERWSDDVAQRDPLHDRYVVLFFTAESRFTRMFSNVMVIPPIFPSTEAGWKRLLWGEPIKTK